MFERLVKLYKSNDISMYQREGLDNFFECETGKTYKTILDVAKEKGANRIFDIGCAYGHQSEVFINSNIDYVGINDSDEEFWNNDKYEYIVGKYPFKLNTNKNDIAVSVLCLTWNCYLIEGEKTLYEQLEQLSNDFDKIILYLPKDKIEYVLKYFPKYEHITDNIYYFEK